MTGLMVELPPEFRTTSLAYYVWGRSARACHVLAYALAAFADPVFRWVSVRESARTASEEEGWVRRLLPTSRVFDPVSGEELGQGPRLSKQTFQSLIRPEGAAAERIALDHLFLLPPRFQQVLEETPTGPGCRAIVVANTNRIRQFYPTDPDRLRAFTDVFPRSGISIIATSVPPPYRGRYAFDIVLRLDGAVSGEWRTAHVVVEKGLRSGEFRTGASFGPDRLPWFQKAGETIEAVPR